jgi:ABC-2 type transport system permease protein
MTLTTTALPVTAPPPRRATPRAAALFTLAARRLALTVRTPREIIPPVMTPVLFAVVIAPALADTLGNALNGMDYMTFVAVSTIGLLVPLSCLQAGLGVIVDRHSGARRDLLAAPVPRALAVFGNLGVAVFVSAAQLVVLLGCSWLRGADFDSTATRAAWFIGTATLFAVAMYGVAEIMANTIPTQEEYIGALPAVAIVPWFFAGSLFPIDALPAGLTAFSKALPITHVLALLRYGLVDPTGTGLHDIWGMDDATSMAALSFGIVAVFAAAMCVVAVKVFTKAAVQ